MVNSLKPENRKQTELAVDESLKGLTPTAVLPTVTEFMRECMAYNCAITSVRRSDGTPLPPDGEKTPKQQKER